MEGRIQPTGLVFAACGLQGMQERQEQLCRENNLTRKQSECGTKIRQLASSEKAMSLKQTNRKVRDCFSFKGTETKIKCSARTLIGSDRPPRRVRGVGWDGCGMTAGDQSWLCKCGHCGHGLQCLLSDRRAEYRPTCCRHVGSSAPAQGSAHVHRWSLCVL